MDNHIYDIIEEMVDIVVTDISKEGKLPVSAYEMLSELFGEIPEENRAIAFRNFLIGLDVAGIVYDKSQFQGA